MTVPASKVKSLCTAAEVELVRSSRRPQINQLTAAEAKRLATRARKLFDKWEGLSRRQSRENNQKVGSAEAAANTQLKIRIFRDALDSFEKQLASLQDGAAPSPPAKAKTKQPAKRTTALKHRAARVATRKELTAAKRAINASAATGAASKKPAKKKPTTAGAAPQPTKAKSAAKKLAVRPPRTVDSQTPLTKPDAKPNRAQQRKAVTAAKETRLARSGKTSRMVGHVSARGKRAQARRDSQN